MKYKALLIKLLIIFLLYLGISLVVHQPLWSELRLDNSRIGAVHGEIIAVEWGQENLYRNIKSFKNPFSTVDGLLYPFGTNLLSSDSGNGFFFIFLRPFFSTHQSNMLIWISQVILANFGMFLLLETMGVSSILSFLLGLAFGYMTFLTLRIGHMTYFSIYVFPWLYYFLLKIKNGDKSNAINLIFSVGASLMLALSLYHNLYYFIMILMSLIFLFIYLCCFEIKLLANLLKENILWLLLILIFFLLLIIPWIKILFDTYLFEGLPKVEGWGGAIQFSSDLFGYFIPSAYGYFLGKFGEILSRKFIFASGIFENFTYPGLIILFSYVGGLLLIMKKKLSKNDLRKIYPNLFIAFSFWILTLGPFLHVFGKWGITLDEGIRVVFPLPYVLFHKIPLLNNIRSPGRLIVPFVFFSYILSSLIISFYLKNKSKVFKIIFYGFLFFILVLDQYFVYSPPLPTYYPIKAYKKIAEDNRKITVLEAPSVVRDGFVYFGDLSGFNFFYGQPIYNKPVLAGYFGRVPSFKRDYYVRNPLLGYVGRLIDENINTNGGLDRTDLEAWKSLDISKAIDSANFLDIGYFVIDDDKSYTASLSANFSLLGFKKIMADKNYSLWKRDVEKKEFLNAFMGKDDEIYLGMGWNNKEIDGRWVGQKSSILFKVADERKYTVDFTARAFYKDIPVTIYVDEKKITKILMTVSEKNFKIPVHFNLAKGIHTVFFLFDKSYKPSEMHININDERDLSAKFKQVSLNIQN
ncbi:MAG: hypothetical protein WC744_01035 [Patescibacteria group bacterium]|jgi:hypothetical protein